jgi:hypothetical protein
MVITTYWTVQYHNAQDSSMNFQALKILDFIEISRNLLTFKRRMGQFCPIRYTSFLSRWENTVLQWEFKLNSALA